MGDRSVLVLSHVLNKQPDCTAYGATGYDERNQREVGNLKADVIAGHNEPFSSWVAVVFGVLEDDDRLDDGGGAVWAAVQFGQ
jgi:hypothetical protein